VAGQKAVDTLIRRESQNILGQHGKVFKFHTPSPPELPNDMGLFQVAYMDLVRLLVLSTQTFLKPLVALKRLLRRPPL
jgi:hypothetical protein